LQQEMPAMPCGINDALPFCVRSKPAYKSLATWQRAMDLVEQCYQTTSSFPVEERYGLTSQIRRAAVSIPSNVAEGYCRRTTKSYKNHVGISLGSHGELETCFEVAQRLKFISLKECDVIGDSLDHVGRLLSGLYRSLEEKIRREKKEKKAKKASTVDA
jgi:four helix bundle protein